MNYEKIYYAIINKALRKELSGQRWKGDGNYYEKHHIKPRSLEGTDCNNEELEIHSVVQLLKRHIPLYKNIISRKNHGAGFKPKLEYVGIYE